MSSRDRGLGYVSRLSRAGGGGQGQGGGQMTLKRGNGFTIFSYGSFKCGLSRIYGHKLKGDTLVCFLPYWRFKKTSSAFWEMSPSLLIPLQWSHATCFQSKISWQSPGYNLQIHKGAQGVLWWIENSFSFFLFQFHCYSDLIFFLASWPAQRQTEFKAIFGDHTFSCCCHPLNVISESNLRTSDYYFSNRCWMLDQRSLLFAAELGVLLSREMFVRAQKLKKKSVRNKLSTHPLPPLCYCGDLLFFSQTFIPHLFPDVTFFCLLLSPQPISPCVLSFFKWRLPAFSAGIFLLVQLYCCTSLQTGKQSCGSPITI